MAKVTNPWLLTDASLYGEDWTSSFSKVLCFGDKPAALVMVKNPALITPLWEAAHLLTDIYEPLTTDERVRAIRSIPLSRTLLAEEHDLAYSLIHSVAEKLLDDSVRNFVSGDPIAETLLATVFSTKDRDAKNVLHSLISFGKIESAPNGPIESRHAKRPIDSRYTRFANEALAVLKSHLTN